MLILSLLKNLWVQPGIPAPANGSFMTISTTVLSPTSRTRLSFSVETALLMRHCFPGGSITLSSADPLAHPIISPNFLATDWDIYVLRESVKKVQKFLTADAWKDYVIGPFGDYAKAVTDAEIEAYARANAATFFHPISTAMMSPKGADWGVTDPDLKVKGVEGLRIVDASVIVSTVQCGFSSLAIYIYSTAIPCQRSHCSTCIPLRRARCRPHQGR